jgi:hypothetical protein
MSKESFLEGVGNDLVNELVLVAPVDTSFLRNSISYEIVGDKVRIMMPEYALFLEYGTAPHIIKPVNAKALHWKGGGGDVFAKEVHHPGTSAQPFIRNTCYHKLKEIIDRNAKIHLKEDVDVKFK